MTPSSSASRAAGSAGRSDARKYAPFDVPLRVSYNGQQYTHAAMFTYYATPPANGYASGSPLAGSGPLAGGALVTVQDNGLLEEGSDYSCRFGDAQGDALAPATYRANPARVQRVEPSVPFGHSHHVEVVGVGRGSDVGRRFDAE